MNAESPILRANEDIKNGAKFKKCWKCGCQHETVLEIEKLLPKLKEGDRALLKPVLEDVKAVFQRKEYDCQGCKVCFPAAAINELMKAYPDLMTEAEEDTCASEDIDAVVRRGWPPLPGNYNVMRYRAPVAVCTLNSKELIHRISESRHYGISIVGSLNTENLGIERLIRNVSSNPNIRFLIFCGEDSKQKVGHLPGQSIVSLFQNGVDENNRIISAAGKRPVLKNIDRDLINHFRRQVEHIDMIGCLNAPDILARVDACARESRGAYTGGDMACIEIPKIEARPPRPLQIDPKGYFVIFPSPERECIVVEHYGNDGTLNVVVEGKDITYIYMTAVDMGLLSRLDHACYFGKELQRAVDSLRTKTPYEQDMAQDAQDAYTASNNKKASCGSAGCC